MRSTDPAARGAATATLSYLAASVPVRLSSAGLAVALPLLAVQRMDDIALGALLVAAGLAPSVLVAPFVGALLDRARRPALLIGGAALGTALAFAFATLLGSVPTPLVVAALILSGALTPFYMGGLSSLVADVIPDERRAFGQDALSYNVAGVGGPGLVAVLLVIAPAGVALLVLAVLAALGGVATLGLRARPHDAERHRGGVLASIGAGVRYLVLHRPLAVITASGTLSQFGAGALPIAAVALASTRTGSGEAGAWLVTAFSIGALVGSLLAAVFARASLAPHAVMLWGFLLTGVATLAVIPELGIVVALGAVALSGLASAPATAAMLLLRKQQSPAAVRAQVFTVGAGLRASAAALGVALAGALALPPVLLFALIGSTWIVSALLLVAYPAEAAPVGAPRDPADAAN